MLRSIFQLVLLPALLLAEPSSDAPVSHVTDDELLFMIQYISADYGAAVEDGKTIDVHEYEEMVEFSGRAVEAWERRVANGASAVIGQQLNELQKAIWNRRSWNEIRGWTKQLVPAITEELGLVSFPVVRPDLERGRSLYLSDCAPCHGQNGGGDGWTEPWMDPPDSCFNDDRMRLLFVLWHMSIIA